MADSFISVPINDGGFGPLFLESDMDEITAEMFQEFTGRKPENDDLERCNCDKVGQPGHMQCGWNKVLNLPRFEVGDSVK